MALRRIRDEDGTCAWDRWLTETASGLRPDREDTALAVLIYQVRHFKREEAER